MQNPQVQCFRPPILVRRSCARGVMERAFPFSLSFRIVCHISLSVLDDASDTPSLNRDLSPVISESVSPYSTYHHGIRELQYMFPIRTIGVAYGNSTEANHECTRIDTNK